MVSDLLELAKLESGAFSLHCGARRPFQGGDRVDPGVHSRRGRAGAGYIDRSLTPGREVFCDADPDRLGQVVANVVENALKYATSRVAVKTGRFDVGQPTVLVEDDGPGIPPQDLERVFERLYQSRLPADRKVSSGLGLAIVDELVSAMGGTVRAESPIGPAGGTRFVIVLQAAQRRARGPRPITAAPPPPAATQVHARPGQRSSGAANTRTGRSSPGVGAPAS